ncbi:MAG: tyrosine-protein phosphatase [Actinomycetota bacterium]
MTPAAGGLLPNLRDLGGARTADGRRVRSGLLFRSDGLQRLATDDAASVVSELRLRTLIDLRSELERERTGEVELAGPSIHRLPILDGSYMQSVDQGARLDDMLGRIIFDETAQLAAAVQVLAAPGALPGLFFCTAGKDRTGVLTALLLTALGVERSDVVEDFARSEGAMQQIMAAFLANFEDGELPDIPVDFVRAPAELMGRLLVQVDERAGGAGPLLVDAGLDEAALERLAGSLLA